MERTMTALKGAVAVFGGAAAYWLGGIDTLLKSLIALMALDYITGLASAFVKKNLSSEIGYKGILKKIVQLSGVALAFIVEELTVGGLPLRELTIMFFVANEGVSIMENMANIGVPFPKKLKSALLQIKEGQ